MGEISTHIDMHTERVPVIALASWAAAQRPLVQEIELLKIDVEGGEWKVLLGAAPMLMRQRIGMIILEYSHFWFAEPTDLPETNGGRSSLSNMAVYMDEHGYDGYFVGSRHLVPFTGVWWDDTYEVCAKPNERIYRGLAGWCWFNVAFVLRNTHASSMLRRMLPIM